MEPMPRLPVNRNGRSTRRWSAFAVASPTRDDVNGRAWFRRASRHASTVRALGTKMKSATVHDVLHGAYHGHRDGGCGLSETLHCILPIDPIDLLF